jgi:hypothetical protein
MVNRRDRHLYRRGRSSEMRQSITQGCDRRIFRGVLVQSVSRHFRQVARQLAPLPEMENLAVNPKTFFD